MGSNLEFGVINVVKISEQGGTISGLQWFKNWNKHAQRDVRQRHNPLGDLYQKGKERKYLIG